MTALTPAARTRADQVLRRVQRHGSASRGEILDCSLSTSTLTGCVNRGELRYDAERARYEITEAGLACISAEIEEMKR